MCVADDVKASERTHVVKDLPGTVYKLWMTASTAKGEGHAGQKVYVQSKNLSKFLFFVFFLQIIRLYVLQLTVPEEPNVKSCISLFSCRCCRGRTAVPDTGVCRRGRHRAVAGVPVPD